MESSRVFVVHGRNLSAKDAMFTFLRALGLEPLEWAHAVSLTKKAAPTTLEVVKAGFENSQCTVVLMTGDDISRLRPELGDDPPLYQPRPNVFFEAGWAMAKGGKKQTVLVRFGFLREFSDLSGINAVEINNSPAARSALVQRLKVAGCHPDDAGSDYLRPETGGNFDLIFDDAQNNDILDRGGFTDFVVDSSLSQSLNNLDFYAELCDYLTRGGFTSLKYNYLGVTCAQNWLALSQDPTYGHSELVSAFKDNAFEIVRRSGFAGREVDFVSLGPGDGLIDLSLLHALQQSAKLRHYYPIDISLELLQRSVSKVVSTGWLQKTFKIKAVHGDFTRLSTYRPIYGFDSAPNFFSLVGYSLGNYNEAELIGKLREGMEFGDLLLLDARLHHQQAEKVLSSVDEAEITASYNHALNNRFAFGPVELATFTEHGDVCFRYSVNRRFTAVPGALNIVTYCENVDMKMRRTNKKIFRKRLDLAVATLYDAGQLESWLQTRGFENIWRKEVGRSLLVLLRKCE